MSLDFFRISRGIRLTPQSSAPASPAEGDVYFDSTLVKLRVYQNGTWVNITDSDGTVLLANGSAGSPSLAFTNSLTTGLFRAAADAIGFSIAGSEKARIDSSGNFNILSQADLRLQDTTGGEYVGHKAPGTVTSSHTYTWPAALPAGNRVLQTDNTGVLSWIVAGTVTGPGSSTDNAIVRFDGTGGTAIQNSGVSIDDSNNVSGFVNITSTGQLLSADGTASAPGFSFSADSDNGLYRIGTNNIGIAVAGVKLIDMSAAFVSIERATAGDVTLRVLNSDTTNTSDAKFQLTTASSAAGDPQLTWTVTGSESWTMGIDNSSTVLAISNATALGSNRWEMDTSGNINQISGYAQWSQSIDSSTTTDAVRITGYDLSAGNRTLSISTERAVATDAAVVSTHSLSVRINGTTYRILLAT